MKAEYNWVGHTGKIKETYYIESWRGKLFQVIKHSNVEDCLVIGIEGMKEPIETLFNIKNLDFDKQQIKQT